MNLSNSTFFGFRRENGRVGVRNHVLILPVDDLSNAAAQAVEHNVKGTLAIPHPYGRLAGTERTQFVRERPGQLGYVWEWTVMLSYPGQHEYTFYVDSTIPCKKIELTVGESLATKTPKP